MVSFAPGSKCQIPVNGPGAVWIVLCGIGKTITAKDYNGDSCVLPHGITVKVNKYGQFVPMAYNPNKQ